MLHVEYKISELITHFNTHALPTMAISANLILLVVLLVSFSCSLQEVCVVPDGGSSEPPPSCETTTSLNHFCKKASDELSSVALTTSTQLVSSRTL